MPMLKAGILMREHGTRHKHPCLTAHKGRIGAFTFVEVLIALAIVSISLLALLRLHLTNASMIDHARIMSQAVFLADEKIAETLAAGFPEEGSRSGVVERNGLTMRWKTRVESAPPIPSDAEDVAGLRKVLVDVSWNRGVNTRHLRMSTYVADRKLP